MLGFSVALRPDVLWYGFLGCLVGTLVGVLPGIGPLSGISILLPITFGLDATKAIVMLAGIYYGSQYGGSTTSILMRIPGEASSVMTCIDGYAMARKGRAGAALCIAAVGSWIAGTFGVVMLTVIAPPLAAFALRFGPPEYTALLVLGLIFLAYMSSTSLPRTLLMAAIGLLLGTIGMADRTRQRAWLSDRPYARFGAHHLELSLLRGGAQAFEASGGVRSRRRGGCCRAGIRQQRRLDRRLCADAGARSADRAGDSGADGGADPPRRAAGPPACQRASRCFLGLRRLHVCGQRAAASAQPAAGRPVRERAADSLQLPLSAGDHVLPDRRLHSEQLDR